MKRSPDVQHSSEMLFHLTSEVDSVKQVKWNSTCTCLIHKKALSTSDVCKTRMVLLMLVFMLMFMIIVLGHVLVLVWRLACLRDP